MELRAVLIVGGVKKKKKTFLAPLVPKRILIRESKGDEKAIEGRVLLNVLTAVDGHQLLGPALWSVTDGLNLTFPQSSGGAENIHQE